MSKKTKSRWRWAFWALVFVCGVIIVTAPLKRGVPKSTWRVPVQLSMPDVPSMAPVTKEVEKLAQQVPDLPDLDMNTQDLGKLRAQTEKALSDLPLPSLSYEEKIGPEREHKPEVQAPVPLPPPAAAKGRKGRVAIVIDDMGLAHQASLRAVRLPAAVTLAYLPYAPNLRSQAEGAAAAGHDLMLHMPMEPMGDENPGPGALLSGQSQREWEEKIDAALTSFDGFIGVNNHMGSLLTTQPDAMALLSGILQERGLFFVDSRTSNKSVAATIARQTGVKVGVRDVFLDDTQTLENVRHQLAVLEQLALKKGQAIAIGHPHAVTLQALEAWIPQAQSRGVALVPVKDLVE